MKGTDNFKKVIQEYLENRAKEDALFATSFNKPRKSIDECCIHIINQVHRSGCNGFSSSEIFGMAVHYYDEDNIDVGQKINCKVVVNRTIELTEDEKEQARKDAIQKYQEVQIAKIKEKQAKSKKKVESVVVPSLFD